jgi:outer membrane autotransporter protein
MRWVIRDLAALEDVRDAMPGDTVTLDDFSSNEPLGYKYRGLSAGSPDVKWGVWTNGSGSFLGNNTSIGYSGGSELGLAGLDFLADRQWLLGFSAGYTHADLTLTPTGIPRLSRQVDGGLVGPYASYIINPHMALDALFNYTTLENSISAPTPLPNGGYHSNRVTAAAHLNIFTNYDALKLTGFGGYAYTWEGGSTSSVIGPGFGLANYVRYGAIRLGGEVSYRLDKFEPYIPLTFEYETTKPNDGTSRTAVVLGGGLRYRWNDTLAGELLAETTEVRTHTRDVLISAHLRQSF